jgi:hypothetical protein
MLGSRLIFQRAHHCFAARPGHFAARPGTSSLITGAQVLAANKWLALVAGYGYVLGAPPAPAPLLL